MNDGELNFEFNASLPAWVDRIAVFDLETTGLDLRQARIVTASLLELDNQGNPIGRAQEWLADAEIEIPSAASAVHGVTTEIARRDGRNAAEVVSEIVQGLRVYFEANIPVVAYNAPYDFSILYFEALRHNLAPISKPRPVLDPLVLDKAFDTYRKGKRTLEVVASHYSVPLDNAHNSSADALAAGRVALQILRKYSDQVPQSAAELHDQQVTFSDQNDASYERFRQGTDPNFTVQRGWPIKK